MSVPNDLDLSDRPAALQQLGVGAAANSRLLTIAKDHIGSERETVLLASTRAWPLLEARMADVARGPEGEQGLREKLKAGLLDNTAWQQGPPGELAGRMVGATLRALTDHPARRPCSRGPPGLGRRRAPPPHPGGHRREGSRSRARALRPCPA
ncbi:hypothetical protein [Streptomyces sp. NPDC007369]|uniref:hypothetical protein n=1 Tax=Streptomyces sp. NPDC007369 TaxID=3154589 RepID=UPI0033D29976